MEEDCTHTWGYWNFCDESGLIYSREELEKYRAVDDLADEFTFCPDCGIRLKDKP